MSGTIKSTTHTFVFSDLHLTDAEPGRPGRALWKRYKRPKFFIDRSFKALLDRLMSEPIHQAELVLNGDIFDFDSVMELPKEPLFSVSWLEKKRGLHPEEEKSRFKMDSILNHHPIWLQSIRDWIRAGHSVVFVIGNHDVELHWPSVQGELIRRLSLTVEEKERIRFCEWFYISESDTLIEHGNQYDDYCVTQPIHPLIKKGRKIRIRLPFGNITSRYMINGMGLFNPHVETTFLMTLPEYIRFFYRYSMRVHPWLPLTYMWGAMVSFWSALGDGFLPAMRDPLFTEQRIEQIAEKAKASPKMVRMLRELHTHPAVFNPLKIARELWLDRLFILISMVSLSFMIFSFVRIFVRIPGFWGLILLVLCFPVLIYYAKNIKSEVFESQEAGLKQVPLISKIASVSRIVFGHTHRAYFEQVESDGSKIEILNSGTWSPAFKDPECRVRTEHRCFIWIAPGENDRQAKLCEWKETGIEIRAVRG